MFFKFSVLWNSFVQHLFSLHIMHKQYDFIMIYKKLIYLMQNMHLQ